MAKFGRRAFLTAAALAIAASRSARAKVIEGRMPWRPRAADPPAPAVTDRWVFFTPDEAAAVEAIVDRIIPPDPETPGGKDAGCAHFIDNQLAGAYGSSEGLYRKSPFEKGSQQQGSQSELTPAGLYRKGLAEFDNRCRSQYGGKAFAQLSSNIQDEVLEALEHGSIEFQSQDSKAFFKHLLKDTREGFLADPVYGGNRDMCGWKMIGFPGARYDYRGWVSRHNERYPYPPVSIRGRSAWNVSKS